MRLSVSGSADATSVGEPAFSEGGSDHLPHDSSTWPSVSAKVGCAEIAFGPLFLAADFPAEDNWPCFDLTKQIQSQCGGRDRLSEEQLWTSA